jgi:hypothetical protein
MTGHVAHDDTAGVMKVHELQSLAMGNFPASGGRTGRSGGAGRHFSSCHVTDIVCKFGDILPATFPALVCPVSRQHLSARFILLGTNHPLQFGETSRAASKVEAFYSYVVALCETERVALIAEEASVESLRIRSVTETVASKVARDRGLKYLMVDLCLNERTLVNVADGQLADIAMSHSPPYGAKSLRDRLEKLSDQVRETAWVARTLQAKTWPALLIVCADHVKAVERLVRSLQQRIDIAHANFEP